MFKYLNDAVIAFGSHLFVNAKSLYRGITETTRPREVTGEYIGKGEVNHSRRAFFNKGALTTAMVVCFVMLPSVSFAAVDVAITTAISDALADVGTVASAVFAVLVAAAAFRWLRRAL